MSNPLALHLHTLDSLLRELVSGRPVLVGDDGEQYAIENEATRSILDWFMEDKSRWTGQVRGDGEANAIVQASQNTPPTHSVVLSKTTAVSHPTYTVKKVRAYQFAGLHTYGSTEEVSFELSENLTLFEGKNGSGKTSLLNALIWCLTGKLLRSQQLPKLGEEVIDVMTEVEENGETKEVIAKSVAVSPTPSRTTVVAHADTFIPINTWIEVTLADVDGNEQKFKRRTYLDDKGKKLLSEIPDFTPLGLQPNALEIGTVMPGMLPLIQIGTANDIGQAVAKLTGFNDLRDLADRAGRFNRRMMTQMTSALQAECERLENTFIETWQEFVKRLNETPILQPSEKELLNRPTTSEHLQALENHLNALESDAFKQAQKILGSGFDPSDKGARQELSTSNGPALGLAEIKAILSLSSARRLIALKGLNATERQRIEAIINDLFKEYQEIAVLAASPDIAARERLYARVADWMRDADKDLLHLDNCALCDTSLEGKADPVTGQPVHKHLRTRLDEVSDALSHTFESWANHVEGKLARELPEGLRQEMGLDLPGAPSDLMTQALTDELFDQQPFQKSLSALKSKVEEICKATFSSLPGFNESAPLSFPDGFSDRFDSLSAKLTRIHRALTFAYWRDENDAEWDTAVRTVVGTAETANETSINGLLSTLAIIIENADPIRACLKDVGQLKSILDNANAKKAGIALLATTAQNIEPLLDLGILVDRQMETLRRELHTKTEAWKDKVYSSAYTSAPKHAETAISAKGELHFSSESNGTRTPSQHVSNSSDMRATLFAFLLAFWKHMRDTHGGMDLLVFDDPQELFDRDNRRNLANGITLLAKEKAQMLVASYDPAFSDTLVSSMRRSQCPSCEHRRVSPAQENRQYVAHDLMESDLALMYKAFLNPPQGQEHLKARLYVSELRVYIENRLSEFLPERLPGLSTEDTLAPFLSQIKTFASQGMGVFADQAFQKILNDP
ncbi:MAG: AAA family ATPase, partial [Rhodospirillaceae bacterium]|nr:AAA family ATPase [Rhodospirillaceae bacterium]